MIITLRDSIRLKLNEKLLQCAVGWTLVVYMIKISYNLSHDA